MAKEASKQKPSLPQIDVRKLMFFLGGILLGYLVMYIYFEPARKANNVLNQSDILQVRGMSKEIHDFRDANDGEETLWTSRMFGGMPTYQIDARYPNNLLYKLNTIIKLGLPHPAGHMFLLFLGMYILLIVFRVDPWVAAAGGLAYAFSSYFFIAMEAGHNAKINALGYAPMVLAGITLTYRGRLILGGALFSLAMGLELLANHFQITYYLIFIVLAMVISELAMSVRWQNRLILLGLLLVPVIWMIDPCNDLQTVWLLVAFLSLVAPLGVEFVMNLGDGGWSSPNFARARQFILGSVVLLIGGGIAVAPNLGRLYTTSEYKNDTMRGGVILENANHCSGGQAAIGQETDPDDCGRTGGLKKPYAYNWSYGVGETFTLITPFYMGDASMVDVGTDSESYKELSTMAGPQQAAQMVQRWPMYFGEQPFTSGPVYIGASIFFLFVLGLLIVNNRYRWWLLGATILGILLSWGKNWQWFSDLFFDHFPLYNNFRAVSMTLVIAEITMPILGALALHKVLMSSPEKRDKLKTNILIAGGVSVALLLIVLVYQSVAGEFFNPLKDGSTLDRIAQGNPQVKNRLQAALIDDRSSLFMAGMLRSIGLVIGVAGALFVYLQFIQKQFEKTNPWVGRLAVGVVVLGIFLLDLVPIAKRYIDDDNFVNKRQFMSPHNPDQADLELLADPDPNFRVLSFERDPWNDAFTSYHHKSIGGYHAAKFRRYQDLIDCHLDSERGALLTGLQSGSYDQALQKTNVLNMLNMKYVMVPTQSGLRNLQNQYRYGNAWGVENIKSVKSNIDEIDALGEVDLKKTAVVHEDFQAQINGFTPNLDPGLTIAIASYKPNHIVYNYNAPGGQEQLVVFSEIFYQKGWQAYVDGQPTDHFRVNYVLRGARIPGGKHSVEFKFEPQSYATGEQIGLVGSILLIVVVAGAGALWFLGRLKDPVDPEI